MACVSAGLTGGSPPPLSPAHIVEETYCNGFVSLSRKDRRSFFENLTHIVADTGKFILFSRRNLPQNKLPTGAAGFLKAPATTLVLNGTLEEALIRYDSNGLLRFRDEVCCVSHFEASMVSAARTLLQV